MRTQVFSLIVFLVLAITGLPQKSEALPSGSSLVEQNGLNWLSPIWSQNITYSDMVSRLMTPGSDYFGLRVATTYEVVGMLNSYPLLHPGISGPFSIGAAIDDSRIFGPAFGVMDPFFNEFGWYEPFAFPGGYSRELSGYSWDPVLERLMVTNVAESDIYGGLFSSDHYEIVVATFDTSIIGESPLTGTYLVAPVPEPATLFLVAGGIAILALWRRRNKQKALRPLSSNEATMH